MSHQALGPQFGEQLPMFETAHALMHNYRPGDSGLGLHQDDATRGELRAQDPVWDAKRRYNAFTSLPDRIRRDGGVEVPVHVHGGMLQNGHHRVAAAYDINPQSLLPVTHDSSRGAFHEWEKGS